jgi:hypothetical protein
MTQRIHTSRNSINAGWQVENKKCEDMMKLNLRGQPSQKHTQMGLFQPNICMSKLPSKRMKMDEKYQWTLYGTSRWSISQKTFKGEHSQNSALYDEVHYEQPLGKPMWNCTQ